MYLMRNHDIWIYVRCANSDPRIAFDRLYDLIDEAAGHGFLVRGTSFDHCSGNTLKDRIGLRTMLDAVENGRIEAVMVRDLEQISRNSYDMVSDLKEGGSFLLACDWADVAALDAHLPVSMRRAIAKKHINLYVIDSVAIAAELGLGNRTNTILQAAFFHITGIIPDDKAVEYMKAAALKSYGKKGEKVVNMNYAAVDRGICGAVKIDYPASWADLADEPPAPRKNVPEFVTKIMEPVNNMHGDELPVSAFAGLEDGTWPQATSKYEKRGVAVKVPAWDASKCVQCNQCSYVCPPRRHPSLPADRAGGRQRPRKDGCCRHQAQG